MDYIRKQIDQRIEFLQTMGDKNTLKQHFQARCLSPLIHWTKINNLVLYSKLESHE